MDFAYPLLATAGQTKGGMMKSPNYVAILAILNEILRRVSEALPQIEQATRELRNGLPNGAEIGNSVPSASP